MIRPTYLLMILGIAALLVLPLAQLLPGALAGSAGKHHEEEHEDHDSHVSEGRGFRVVHAWTRATNAKTALVFMEIENEDDHELVLEGAETSIAAKAGLVAFRLSGGKETYPPLERLPVAPSSHLELEPRGAAIRLEGLKRKLKKGQEFELVLGLGREGEHFHLTVQVQVEAADAKRHSHAGHQH